MCRELLWETPLSVENFNSVTQRDHEGAAMGTHPAGQCFQESRQQVPSQELGCEFLDQQNG